MKKIILITGGQRSGKSTYAEERALSLCDNPVYLATAKVWDAEFAERVRRHKRRRGKEWINIEEELYLSHHNVEGRVVLVDCVTLWATNYFSFYMDKGEEINVDEILDIMKQEFDSFTSQQATFIFVTNEIGCGGVSDNVLQRRFTDLQGWLNQYIASCADEVVFMVSGIAVKIK